MKKRQFVAAGAFAAALAACGGGGYCWKLESDVRSIGYACAANLGAGQDLA